MGPMMGGEMQGQEQGGGMVQCPCCGQGQVPPEVAEKVVQAMEPPEQGEIPGGDDTAAQLAAAMSAKPMRRG